MIKSDRMGIRAKETKGNDMTETRKYKLLPAGADTFADVIGKGKYYVDKTLYLKTVFEEDGSSVLLFTRPRRFGKTLLMDMFANFLRIKDSDKNENIDTFIDNTILFKDTAIIQDKAFVEKYMGKFPVIFLSLKNIKGDNFTEAYNNLAEEISNLACDCDYLLKSEELSEIEKKKLSRLQDDEYLSDKRHKTALTSSLKVLSKSLYKHFKKQVVIFIDEYDVPLAKATEKKYHDKMVSLMSSFFDVLKSTPSNTTRYSSPVLKVIMTGCLKVAKNSIFTGVNNVVVNTVLDTQDKFTSIIGFNKEETRKFLEDYNLADYENMVKANYDGYKFYDKEMFCPWDVIKFIANNYEHKLNGTEDDIKPGNYWIGTSSNEALYEYLGYLTDSDTQKMQDLVDGKTINFVLNDSMNYDCLSQHNPDDFWSLLLHTGYLTLDWEDTKALEDPKKKGEVQTLRVSARIPNLEIKQCFKENIQNRFVKEFIKRDLPNKLVYGLINGKSESITEILSELLETYVSIRDCATKAPLENYYHGFINGIFTSCENLVSEYHSNFESGNGYADIVFKNKAKNKAIIIEIKATSSEDKLDELATSAISQIEEKNYAVTFTKLSKIKDVYAFGIVFCKKDCLVSCKKIK